MRDSFVLYTEYADHLDKLSMEQVGMLFIAIMNYECDRKIPDMDAAVEMAFSFIKKQLDRDAEKYDAVLEKRREAGLKGGRPQKANGFSEKAKKANGFSEKQTKAKKPVYVNDNDNVNDIENKSLDNSDCVDCSDYEEKEKVKKEKQVFVNPFYHDSILRDAFTDFSEMRRKKKKPLTERAIKMLYTVVCKITADAREQAKLLDYATFKGWDSVYPLKGDFVEARDYYPESKIEPEKPPDDYDENEDFDSWNLPDDDYERMMRETTGDNPLMSYGEWIAKWKRETGYGEV